MSETTVGSLMSDPMLTVAPDDTVAAVAEAMTAAGVNSVVVIDADCAPMGIITSTDYVRLIGEGVDLTETTVESVMTTDVVTARRADGIEDAATAMAANGLSHLPVVDDDGEAVGIVTTTDLATYLADGIEA